MQNVAETVGLSAALDRNAARLSVNDLQKVALGRSMIVEPAIFLLDEPFSNLDSAFRAYMRAELKRIQHEIGQTMVYVTHDQVEAMSMADRIAVMDLGVLQQYGTPDELYNRPANRFVAQLHRLGPEQLPARARTTGGGHGARRRRRRAIDVSRSHGGDRRAGRRRAGLTASIRPERVRVVAPDSAEATISGPRSRSSSRSARRTSST